MELKNLLLPSFDAGYINLIVCYCQQYKIFFSYEVYYITTLLILCYHRLVYQPYRVGTG